MVVAGRARVAAGAVGERSLSGGRVLVTGASSGVGAAAAVAFARAGCDVALLARNRPGLEVVAGRVRGHGSRTLVLPADLTDRDAVEAAVGQVLDAWGGLDVAVSNAAAMAYGPFERVPGRDFDRTVGVTFLGAVNLVRACLPALERSAGVVVVTGSINALAPLPSFAAYAASKAALRSFLRSLRIELLARRSPVRLALVHPGAIDTPVWRSVTSATGRLPRTPPQGYSADAIAATLVAMARRPRAEVIVGGEAKLWSILWRLKPVDELVLALVHRWYQSGRRPARENPLWDPAGDGSPKGPILGRPSLWAPIRMRVPWPPW
jgi:NAD(P)-dependent dehydrogenase (short-subunit alcohol dehydrogenase family)